MAVVGVLASRAVGFLGGFAVDVRVEGTVGIAADAGVLVGSGPFVLGILACGTGARARMLGTGIPVLSGVGRADGR